MEGQSPGANTVSPYELAVLVLHYLDCNQFKKTSQAFRREARPVLGSVAVGLPAGIRNLLELLNDYVALRERESRRQQLQAGNPLAQSLYSVLDFHAGLPGHGAVPPAFQGAPAAAAAPAAAGAQAPLGAATTAMAAAAPQGHEAPHHHHQQPQHPHGASGPLPMIPVQAADLSYPQHPCPAAGEPLASPAQQQGQECEQQQQQQHTPGRQAHRKGAPKKRRRLQDSFDAEPAGCPAAAGGAHVHQQHLQQHALDLPMPSGAGLAPVDLLSLPLDEEGLFSLLCDDDLQVRFASGLAQHITSAMNHQPHTQGLGSEGEEGLLSIEDVLAELPGDPDMAQLLQQVVRVESAGGGGSGAASLSSPPRPGSAGAPCRPGSRQQQQQQQQQPAGGGVAGAQAAAQPGPRHNQQGGERAAPLQPAQQQELPQPMSAGVAAAERVGGGQEQHAHHQLSAALQDKQGQPVAQLRPPDATAGQEQDGRASSLPLGRRRPCSGATASGQPAQLEVPAGPSHQPDSRPPTLPAMQQPRALAGAASAAAAASVGAAGEAAPAEAPGSTSGELRQQGRQGPAGPAGAGDDGKAQGPAPASVLGVHNGAPVVRQPRLDYSNQVKALAASVGTADVDAMLDDLGF